MSEKLDDRVIDLETRIAFLERASDDLSQVVCAQQTLLEDIKLRIRELLEQAKATQVDKIADTKPPHY